MEDLEHTKDESCDIIEESSTSRGKCLNEDNNATQSGAPSIRAQSIRLNTHLMYSDFNTGEWKSIIDSLQHEVQVCRPFETEENLFTHFKTCQKNPDHAGFIPIHDFNVRHIKITKKVEELYNIIQIAADLTVRIAVTYTSTARPKCVEGSVHEYPCSNLRGTNCLRTGTGTIVGVSKFQDEDKKTCQCKGCKDSDNPQTTWWSVGVMTATHVVFDDSEAESATCRLFFDQADSPVVTLDGWRMWDMSIKGDTCRFLCASHDMELYEKVQRIFKSFLFYPNKFEEGVSFIVSHPHGCSKHVSVGKYKRKHIKHLRLNYNATKYSYDLSTCPGSSGAYVFTSENLLVPHVHSGCRNGINYSGEGFQEKCVHI
ncbi:uncharacterized protein LOC131950731 [Physella acuta]|uniref:uncharacterized protein LOC131950731 n=1 Tax=Physella acuta TaxID=109671 RepID=UPI0027DABC7E|nr:uncharacterized protein LOC131950731 [Physella acuta]